MMLLACLIHIKQTFKALNTKQTNKRVWSLRIPIGDRYYCIYTALTLQTIYHRLVEMRAPTE